MGFFMKAPIGVVADSIFLSTAARDFFAAGLGDTMKCVFDGGSQSLAGAALVESEPRRVNADVDGISRR